MEENEEKEVVEITNEIENISDIEVPLESKKTKKKKKLKIVKFFENLTKKQKIILIVVLSVLVLGIVGLVLYLFVFVKDEENAIKDDDVIVQMNNYRYENGKLIFLDDNEKELGEYECSNKDELSCKIASFSQDNTLNNIKYVNESDELIAFDMPIYSDRYVVIYDNESEENATLKLYDIKEKEVYEEYKVVKEYDDNNLILQDTSDLYGVIHFEDEIEVVVDFIYDNLGHIEGNESIAFAKEGKYGVVKLDGTEVTNKLTNPVFSYNDNNVYATGIEGKYKVVDNNNKELLSKEYNYIKVDKDYVYVIDSDKVLVRDLTMNKLTEKGLTLNDIEKYEDYVVYDEDLKKVSDNKLFTTELTDDGMLYVKTSDETLSINTYEKNINVNNKYISYMDGNIYIYSDDEKEVLVGTYTCSSKNVVGKDTTSFDNCFISKESNLYDTNSQKGYIPIYNNRFIFIKDGTTTQLYDYVSSSKKASYKEVDVGYSSSDNSIIHASASNLYVLAKNSKDSLGMITISGEEVKPLIPFENESIKIDDTSYITKKTDGTYHIYDKNGGELTDENSSIKNEIVEYSSNYIMTKDSKGKYSLYSFSGKVISGSLDYIDPEVNYFLGVNGDDVGVYRFTDGTNNILKTPLTKESDNIKFVDSGTNGFTINFMDNNDKVISSHSYDQSGGKK